MVSLRTLQQLSWYQTAQLGVIQFDETTNKFGTFAQLKAIRVTNLIEYKSAGADYDELGRSWATTRFVYY